MALIDNLISYYKCDENAANTTVEDSHGSNTGATVGANTSVLYDASGKINSGFDFADTYHMTMGGVSTFENLAAMSVSCWVYMNGTGQLQRFFRKYDGNGFLFWIGTDGKVTGLVNPEGEAQQSVTSTGALSASAWYHIVITYDGTDIKVYLNNSTPNTYTFSTGGNISANSETPSVGYADLHKVNGIFDELAVWDRAITSSEVSELYNSGDGLAYPFSTATLRLIKIAGTFQDKPIKTKVGGVFVDKPIKVKVGGVFQ